MLKALGFQLLESTCLSGRWFENVNLLVHPYNKVTPFAWTDPLAIVAVDLVPEVAEAYVAGLPGQNYMAAAAAGLS